MCVVLCCVGRPGMDGCRRSDLLFCRSGLWRTHRLRQLQQVPQQLLQVGRVGLCLRVSPFSLRSGSGAELRSLNNENPGFKSCPAV